MYSTVALSRQLVRSSHSRTAIKLYKQSIIPYTYQQRYQTNTATTATTATAQSTQHTQQQQQQSQQNTQQNTGTKQSFFKSDAWTKTVGTIGALANWTIPMAAITHMMTKTPDTIDPKMVATLGIYSCFFMRWALAITPANYPLLFCHFCNALVQGTQLTRYFVYGKPLKQANAATTSGSSTPVSNQAIALQPTHK